MRGGGKDPTGLYVGNFFSCTLFGQNNGSPAFSPFEVVFEQF